MKAPPAEIREHLSYDPETGVFRWLQWRKGRRLGGLAGSRNKTSGYREICFNGIRYYAHRLAWWFSYGEMPIGVDHRDGVPGNDWLANLRNIPQAANMLNCVKRRDSASRWKGVWQCAKSGRWAVDFRGQKLGRFDSEANAATAYNLAAVMHDSEVPRLNLPGGFGPCLV